MKVIIPETLNEISIKQYLDFKKLVSLEQSEDFVRLTMISIFCRLTINDVKKLPLEEFISISVQLQNVLQEDKLHIERFTIDGVEYGFIPNLDNISTSEYLDIEAFKEDELSLMALFYRPITARVGNSYRIKEYKNEEIEERKEIMLKAPVSALFGSMVFFWNLSKDLLKHIRYSSLVQQEDKNQMKISEGVSANDGDGINQLIWSLMVIEQNMQKLLSSESMNFFTT